MDGFAWFWMVLDGSLDNFWSEWMDVCISFFGLCYCLRFDSGYGSNSAVSQGVVN